MLLENLSKIELKMLVMDCVSTVFKHRYDGLKGIKVLLSESEALEILGGESALYDQLTKYQFGGNTMFEKQEVLQLAAKAD